MRLMRRAPIAAFGAEPKPAQIGAMPEQNQRRPSRGSDDDGRGAPAHQAIGGNATSPRSNPSETYRVTHTVTRNNATRNCRRDRRQHAEHPGSHRDALATMETAARPDRCGRRSPPRPASAAADAPPAATSTMRTRRRPFATSSAITATARHAPAVRSTLAAPTLPLPATRTSIPARRASRNANGTDPRVAKQNRQHHSLTLMVLAGALRRSRLSATGGSEQRHGLDAAAARIGRDRSKRCAQSTSERAPRAVADPRDREVC